MVLYGACEPDGSVMFARFKQSSKRCYIIWKEIISRFCWNAQLCFVRGVDVV